MRHILQFDQSTTSDLLICIFGSKLSVRPRGQSNQILECTAYIEKLEHSDGKDLCQDQIVAVVQTPSAVTQPLVL